MIQNKEIRFEKFEILTKNTTFQNSIRENPSSIPKSRTPDDADPSVSSSEYDVTNFQIISWSKIARNRILYEILSKIPQFYRLARVLYRMWTWKSPA